MAGEDRREASLPEEVALSGCWHSLTGPEVGARSMVT
jgi:hypothetical protein